MQKNFANAIKIITLSSFFILTIFLVIGSQFLLPAKV